MISISDRYHRDKMRTMVTHLHGTKHDLPTIGISDGDHNIVFHKWSDVERIQVGFECSEIVHQRCVRLESGRGGEV